MSGFGDRLRRAFGRPERITVTLLIKGRIGTGWQDIDRRLRLPEGATLADLIEHAEKKGIGMRHAIDNSPHLRDTLMLNGERCPVSANLDRALADGDQVYLLASMAGG